ncbi:hypothetical protein [Jiulongibacter sp. NS-SX5]|uniref:hypothetical protein n=1 Tax=Jiulongibacter sp. NS-SX5 TaxID=3463854 RepID=UPI004059E812
MKKIFLILLLSSVFCLPSSVFSQDIGHFYVEDTSAADSGYMRLFGIGNDAYFRKWTGPKYKIATTAYVDSVLQVGGSYEPIITAGTTSQYWRGDKTWQTLNKSVVGLGNVDNTSDVNKPISTATQTALNGKEATIAAGTTSQYWRGDKTWQTLNKSVVGLGNVDNTSDANKPISTAAQAALDDKMESADWIAKWDSVKNTTATHTLNGGLNINGELKVYDGALFDGGGTVTINGGTHLDATTAGQFLMPEEVLFYEEPGLPGQVHKNVSYSSQWGWVDYSELTGTDQVVEADTMSGRGALKLPTYVAEKIPDSSHFVIEADYIRARSSGNSYFDTLRADYLSYNLLKDSIELVLPDFTGVLDQETNFHITFIGSDDDDSLFVYSIDSSFYRKIIGDDIEDVLDSILINKISSIIYFSDTIYYDSKDTGYIYGTTYMSSDHTRTPFRIPSENSPLFSFTLIWKPAEGRYYLL